MIATNQPEVVALQYQTSANLDARMRLHLLYSTNHYGWLRWIFDQVVLPAQAALLELGCGTGKLWQENRDRIPSGWALTLTDQSPGMLQQAQTTLAGVDHPIIFQQADAQAIPFADAQFDAVIANHMLYHVPDLPQALREITRVLKPDGALYAATNGQNHMGELSELGRRFTAQFDLQQQFSIRTFDLENGAQQLQPWFASVECRLYKDALVVPDVDALVDYVFSMFGATMRTEPERQQQRVAFRHFIQQEITAQGGAIHIQKASGLFIAHKGG